MHHRTLYLEALPDAVRLKYADAEGLSDLERELFVETGREWELEAIRLVGFVGLYHLWERYSRAFFLEATGVRWQDRRQAKRSRQSFPENMSEQLAAIDLVVTSDVFDVLNEANAVVNAYKHGDEALDSLLENRPEYFASTGEVETFHIPEGKLEELFDAVGKFWEQLEQLVEIDFSFPSDWARD